MTTALEVDAGDELEALFDTLSTKRQEEIALQHSGAPTNEPQPAHAPAADQLADRAEEDEGAGPDADRRVPKAEPSIDAGSMYERIGNLTRQLHTAIRELGYDKALEKAASDIPDARDRLSYVSRLTGQAAEKTLCAVEIGQGEQQRLQDDAAALAGSWDKFFSADLNLEEFKALAQNTRGFLDRTQSCAAATQHQLTEIMMAQDFHDLTGQVINKLTTLSDTIEKELIHFLLEVAPSDRKRESGGELEGPQVQADGRADVVTNQGQVDELLDSLGF